MIKLRGVSKTFSAKTGNVYAVRNVSLEVEEGEIFGVIGFSGAGKSTLVRCINLLERPESGEVIVNGKNLMALSARELRAERRNIGMIFQHFNLFRSRTAGANVAYPLKYTGMSGAAIEKRVRELLEIAGLSDKYDAYPSQLSGGQKQRVGIARALASNPRVLLCDEATSALDPQTTRSILSLLKSLNKKLGITIVIITHEMGVVKSICTNAAVMEKGGIVECAPVFDIFANPQKDITKAFVATTSPLHKINELIAEKSPLLALAPDQMLARFTYIGRQSVEPLIADAALRFGSRVNIIFADLDIIQGTPVGGMVNIIEGGKEQISATIKWFEAHGVHVEEINANANN